MPFTVRTELVTQPKISGDGPTETSSHWVHPVPYVCLDMVGHVRMHPKSPGEGVAVTPVASHPIVICQAHRTGRTVVSIFDYETPPLATMSRSRRLLLQDVDRTIAIPEATDSDHPAEELCIIRLCDQY